MAERDAVSAFDAGWGVVEALVDAGEPFSYIEAVIDEVPLDEEQRSALWLGGWVRSELPQVDGDDAMFRESAAASQLALDAA